MLNCLFIRTFRLDPPAQSVYLIRQLSLKCQLTPAAQKKSALVRSKVDLRCDPKRTFSGTDNPVGAVSMGKVAKGQRCSVVGCGSAAIRSISPEKVAHSGLNIGNARRAYLCKPHYREFKKLTRKDRQLDKWRFST